MKRFIEDTVVVFIGAALTVAFTCLSLGAAIWSVKWLLKLLGVM